METIERKQKSSPENWIEETIGDQKTKAAFWTWGPCVDEIDMKYHKTSHEKGFPQSVCMWASVFLGIVRKAWHKKYS